MGWCICWPHVLKLPYPQDPSCGSIKDRLQLAGNVDSKHSNHSALPKTGHWKLSQHFSKGLFDFAASESHSRVCPQALLEEWRTELARKPLAMSEMEACSVLGVQQDEGQDQAGPLSEDALKAAYRCIASVHDYLPPLQVKLQQ